jgi:hypothetical protein
VQRGTAFADRAQGHVHRLLDEIPFVARRALHEQQGLEERLVIGALVIHCEAPQQREGPALAELVAPAGPLCDLTPGVRRAIEQGEAGP